MIDAEVLTSPLAHLEPDALVFVLDEHSPASWRADFGVALSIAEADATVSGAPSVVICGGDGPKRLIVCVPLPESGADGLRAAAAAGARAAQSVQARDVVLALPDDPEAAGDIAEGFYLGSYRFDRYRTTPQSATPTLAVHTAQPGPGLSAALRRASVRASATERARDLVNWSPDEKMPAALAEQMRGEAEAASLSVSVWDEAKIEAEGMGGLLGVNRGSLDPPRFVVIEWTPDGTAGDAPIVLVGKTVVYDTGGLSLKSTKDSMDKMKADMAGGAAVFGAMLGAAGLGLPLRLVALLPMSDNRPGVRAYVPGDVLHMHSGTTVEVLNTDAEGRLLLADALSYARSLRPELVIDVATLTGAQGVALGDRVSAVVVRQGDEDLATALHDAGEESGDLVWPLPLYSHYAEQLKSDVADLKNVGGSMGGVVTAAAFLDHFTRNGDGTAAYRWAHLDIARPAFIDAPYAYRPKGGTGFGVRLLLSFLESVATARSAAA